MVKIKKYILFMVFVFIFISACSKQELQNVDATRDMALNNSINEEENKIEEIIDFEELKDDADPFKTDELHWTHMPVTYHIFNPGHVLKDCETYESNKIRKGFSRIEEATNGVVHFKETNLQNADIVISCSFLEDCYKKTTDTSTKDLGYVLLGESICEHTKGLASITETEGNKILKAEIEMIGLAGFSETRNKGVSGFFFGSCGHPTTEIHEILHNFGYEHDSNPNSIMYYQDDVIGYRAYNKGDCVGSNKEIDDWIVEDLIETYNK